MTTPKHKKCVSGVYFLGCTFFLDDQSEHMANPSHYLVCIAAKCVTSTTNRWMTDVLESCTLDMVWSSGEIWFHHENLVDMDTRHFNLIPFEYVFVTSIWIIWIKLEWFNWEQFIQLLFNNAQWPSTFMVHFFNKQLQVLYNLGSWDNPTPPLSTPTPTTPY